jgi:hypothetical protein
MSARSEKALHFLRRLMRNGLSLGYGWRLSFSQICQWGKKATAEIAAAWQGELKLHLGTI